MALSKPQRSAIVNALVTNCGCKEDRRLFTAMSDKSLYGLYKTAVQNARHTRNEGLDMAEEDEYWEGE